MALIPNNLTNTINLQDVALQNYSAQPNQILFLGPPAVYPFAQNNFQSVSAQNIVIPQQQYVFLNDSKTFYNNGTPITANPNNIIINKQNDTPITTNPKNFIINQQNSNPNLVTLVTAPTELNNAGLFLINNQTFSIRNNQHSNFQNKNFVNSNSPSSPNIVSQNFASTSQNLEINLEPKNQNAEINIKIQDYPSISSTPQKFGSDILTFNHEILQQSLLRIPSSTEQAINQRIFQQNKIFNILPQAQVRQNDMFVYKPGHQQTTVNISVQTMKLNNTETSIQPSKNLAANKIDQSKGEIKINKSQNYNKNILCNKNQEKLVINKIIQHEQAETVFSNKIIPKQFQRQTIKMIGTKQQFIANNIVQKKLLEITNSEDQQSNIIQNTNSHNKNINWNNQLNAVQELNNDFDELKTSLDSEIIAQNESRPVKPKFNIIFGTRGQGNFIASSKKSKKGALIKSDKIKQKKIAKKKKRAQKSQTLVVSRPTDSSSFVGGSKAIASEIYNCVYCTKTFQILTDLKKHYRKHLPIKCKICEKKLSIVRLKHHNCVKQCKRCIRRQFLINNLLQHKFLFKSNLKQLKCRECKKKLYSISKPYKCCQCQKLFKRLATLIQHRRSHKLKCKICKKSFEHSFQLKSHQRRYYQKNLFLCEKLLAIKAKRLKAEEAKIAKKNLINHIKCHRLVVRVKRKNLIRNPPQKKFEQPTFEEFLKYQPVVLLKRCKFEINAKITQKASIKKPVVALKTLKLDKKHCKCKFCSKKFKEEIFCRLHERKSHRTESASIKILNLNKPKEIKKVQLRIKEGCPNCENLHETELKTSDLRNSRNKLDIQNKNKCLKNFTLTKKEPKIILICKFCEKVFNSKYEFFLHVRTHSGEETLERNFNCKWCRQIFNTNADYQNHVMVCKSGNNSQINKHQIFESQQLKINSQKSNISNQQSKTDIQHSKINSQKSKIDSQQSKIDIQQSKIDSQKSKIDIQNSKIDNQQSKTDRQQSKIDSQRPMMNANNIHLKPEKKIKDQQNYINVMSKNQKKLVINKIIQYEQAASSNIIAPEEFQNRTNAIKQLSEIIIIPKVNQQKSNDQTSFPKITSKIQKTNEKSYKCKICNRMFSGKKSLICHKLLHGAKTNKKLVPENSSTPPSENKIPSKDVEKRTKIEKENPSNLVKSKLQCPVCKRRFTYKHNFEVHQRYYHEELARFCPFCKKRFNDLPGHMLICENRGERMPDKKSAKDDGKDVEKMSDDKSNGTPRNANDKQIKDGPADLIEIKKEIEDSSLHDILKEVDDIFNNIDIKVE